MRGLRRSWMIASMLASLAIVEGVAQAQQISSNQASVSLSYTTAEALTVNVTPPGNPTTFQGTPPTTGTITISATSSFTQSRTVSIYAYFASNQALTSGASNIPASSIVANIAGGSQPGSRAFNVTSPFTGSPTAVIVDTEAVGIGNLTTPTVSMTLMIQGASGLPAGTYAGTMFVQAQAV